MFKKVAFAVLAGSLALASQVASADDTQFDVGEGRYLGATALPFHVTGSDWMRGAAAAPAPQRLERTHAGVVSADNSPAPYDVPGGYFN